MPGFVLDDGPHNLTFSPIPNVYYMVTFPNEEMSFFRLNVNHILTQSVYTFQDFCMLLEMCFGEKNISRGPDTGPLFLFYHNKIKKPPYRGKKKTPRMDGDSNTLKYTVTTSMAEFPFLCKSAGEGK
jgi:hypothetical protein